MDAQLYYFHDPMCSWCWGYRPTLHRLLRKLPENIGVQYILGGLAADTDELMPAEMRMAIEGYWKKIQGLLGTEFNYDFWRDCQPRRDTYKACRAVIAAAAENLADQMLTAIQHAYYLRAMNPSDIDTLVQLSEELGMTAGDFRTRLLDEETDQKLQIDIALTRQWQVEGFPSLRLQIDEDHYLLPVDYKDEDVTLQVLRKWHSSI